MCPSTSHPEALPGIATLRSLAQSLAMLDAILYPAWEGRYYSFNSTWNAGEQLASMRNGSGDDWFLLFNDAGAVIKGYAHEAPLAKDLSFPLLIQRGVPSDFKEFLNEPAFSIQRATFCIWRRHGDSAWSVVLSANGRVTPDKDGSGDLLRILDGNPETYHAWAEEYYERDVSIVAVTAVFAHEPLSADLVSALNPDLELAEITANAIEIGYPG
jgi:hypothetical protein